MAKSRKDVSSAHIADHYRALIDAGEMQHDDRLPAVSVLAKEYGVAVVTAARALDILKAQGYARATYAGHFVWLGGPARLWEKAQDILNELEEAGQNPRFITDQNGPRIVGRDGGVRLVGDEWERTAT